MSEIIESISRFIFVEDPPEQADVIMLVGSSQPEAAETGVRLWKKGYAPLLLIGGGVSIKTGAFPGPYATEYDFYLDILRKRGVPEQAIFGESRSSFTRETAEMARRAADEKGLTVERAILVCKAFHARRSLMFYQAAFPGTRFCVVPYAGHGITRENWFHTQEGIRRVLGEMRRLGDQFDSRDVAKWLGQAPDGQGSPHSCVKAP